MAKSKSVRELIMDYFREHPSVDMPHGPVVDWVTEQYLTQHDHPPRDTWRAIRKLHQEGRLVKVRKGVYRYEPDSVRGIELFDFPPDVRAAIFRRDKYRCVVCGRGQSDGVELCADHIKPKDKGGDNSIENGQTLCMQHNLMKKNYSQTEAGKRYFIRMYEQAVANDDERVIKFCQDVFDVYDRHGINGHISRPNGG
jgi:hypothetical protein